MQSSRTHEAVVPIVSHCCATVFRLLVQTKVSKGKDTRARRRLRRFTPTRSGDGMRTELGSLWRSSDRLYAPAHAPDTRRHYVSASPCNGPEYKRRSNNEGNLARRADPARDSGLVGFRPLGRNAEQWRPKEKKTAGCLSRAQRGEFPAVLFRPEPRRASAQSADARQGVLCVRYLYFGQANISNSRCSAKPQARNSLKR